MDIADGEVVGRVQRPPARCREARIERVSPTRIGDGPGDWASGNVSVSSSTVSRAPGRTGTCRGRPPAPSASRLAPTAPRGTRRRAPGSAVAPRPGCGHVEMTHQQIGGGGQVRHRSRPVGRRALSQPFADGLAAHAEEPRRLGLAQAPDLDGACERCAAAQTIEAFRERVEPGAVLFVRRERPIGRLFGTEGSARVARARVCTLHRRADHADGACPRKSVSSSILEPAGLAMKTRGVDVGRQRGVDAVDSARELVELRVHDGDADSRDHRSDGGTGQQEGFHRQTTLSRYGLTRVVDSVDSPSRAPSGSPRRNSVKD